MLKLARIVPYIPVTNAARARKFYEEKLGLMPKEEYAGGMIYECGNGSWVFMYPSAGAGTSKASTAFWAVDDVAAEVRELKARGVVFEEYDMPGIKMENSIASAGGAKTAWFKDSEGNILAISQRVSPQDLVARSASVVGKESIREPLELPARQEELCSKSII
jgi:catechol 2,3-dioxygenase-like lactoylglutathione lyase family enzyme